MDTQDLSRRELLLQGSATLTGLALLSAPWLAQVFPSRPGEEVVPWLDQPPANPSAGVVENLQPVGRPGIRRFDLVAVGASYGN